MAERADTKEQLLRAAERLFARDGIHGARVREINELAQQRNPSALHYHFGSRAGLLEAILLRHQVEVDRVVEARLDELEADGETVDVRDIIETVVGPIVGRLDTESGRDWVRIIPQMLPVLSDNIRRGVLEPITPQNFRIMELLRDRISDLPEAVRRERLVDYAVVFVSLLAERAHELESGQSPLLDREQFTDHLTDVLTAVVTAPSTVRRRRPTRSRRR
jgi:AcrR family transcriptional regulator